MLYIRHVSITVLLEKGQSAMAGTLFIVRACTMGYFDQESGFDLHDAEKYISLAKVMFIETRATLSLEFDLLHTCMELIAKSLILPLKLRRVNKELTNSAPSLFL